MKINTQPIEKQVRDGVAGQLEVHSIFYTIQGEGPFTGQPAVFVRLAGCNLQCPRCDTDYTSKRALLSVRAIEQEIYQKLPKNEMRVIDFNHSFLVVITGGEPFRQNIGPLVRQLVSSGMYRVQIETNGTLYQAGLPWDSVTIVCSPKTGKISPLLLPHIDAFKYVISSDSFSDDDGLPLRALDHTATHAVARPPNRYKPIYLQPADEQDADTNKENLDVAVKSCMKHGYTLQLQTHKILGME